MSGRERNTEQAPDEADELYRTLRELVRRYGTDDIRALIDLIERESRDE